MNRLFVSALLLCGAAINTANANSIEVIPSSYSFDKSTDTGAYAYHDTNYTKLTDGLYGVTPWWTDLGHGPAQEWVGWLSDSPVNIDFNFGSATQIDKINIGSIQNALDDVVLPSINIFSSVDGINWNTETSLSVPESAANNGLYKTFSFDNLALTTQYVRISLVHSVDGPWSFADEIDFYQGQVPTPGVLSLLGCGLLALTAIRKKA